MGLNTRINNDQADGVVCKPLIHGFYLYPLPKTKQKTKKQNPSLFGIHFL